MTIARRRLPRHLAVFATLLAGPLLLAACSADLPETPPPADVVLSPSLYVIAPDTPVDGTFRLTLRRGSEATQGILQTNGQSFRFTVSGLTVQDGAPARATVAGRVFGLERSGSFAGIYRDVGGQASDLGAALRLGNDNLVLIELRSVPPGLSLGVPPEGATVTLAR